MNPVYGKYYKLKLENVIVRSTLTDWLIPVAVLIWTALVCLVSKGII